jgi:8-oxo-dGTP diphosphatase
MWILFNDLLNIRIPKTDWYIYNYIFANKPFAISAEYEDKLNFFNNGRGN